MLKYEPKSSFTAEKNSLEISRKADGFTARQLMSELTWLSFDMLNLILTILYSKKKNDRKIMPCFSCHKVQWLRAVIDLNGKKTSESGMFRNLNSLLLKKLNISLSNSLHEIILNNLKFHCLKCFN